MTKLIFIIMLIPCLCFSQIKGFIESGKDISNNIYYVEMQIGYSFNIFNFNLYPYGNEITWFELDGHGGNPFRNIYTVGADLKYYNIILNAEHFCSHRVVSEHSQNHRYNDVPLDGRLTKLSARYEF